jgi:hypothetical protein
MARDFRVFFLSDGTAVNKKNAVEVQRVTLQTLRAFAQILTVDEMIQKIRYAASAAPSTV